ncbi:MAG: hypothetical protein OEV40_02710 [Acidimicrobiia bacterium]|nr:hypothetical protein [Acidimicrobiia bacterium]
MADDDRRVELIRTRDDGQVEAARVGAGLLIGLLAGHRSLLGAAGGRIAFEAALGYFVLAVLLSVAGTLVVGRMYDRFSARASDHQSDTATKNNTATAPQHTTQGDGEDEPADINND